VQPQDVDAGAYEAAIEAIRRGAEQVLHPLGVGATIRVGGIVLHPVDFKPRKFEQYTAEELKRLVTAREP
jgi:hypothetical protein